MIVLDVAHPRTERQFETVMKVLDEIGATDQQRFLLLNKTDLLEHNADLLVMQQHHRDALAISAKTGAGLDQLTERVRDAMRGGELKLRIELPIGEGKAIHFLESRADVLDRQYIDDHAILTVRIGNRQFDQLKAMGAPVRVIDPAPSDALM